MLRLRSAQAWATPASCFEGPQHTAFGDADADGLPDILQENQYYPFGMAMTMSSTLAAAPPNNYLYNGKELQDELDLGWYDYGARMYEASTGRWNGVDALGEQYSNHSPYVYTANNPILFIDPDGNSFSTPTWGEMANGGSMRDRAAAMEAKGKKSLDDRREAEKRSENYAAVLEMLEVALAQLEVQITIGHRYNETIVETYYGKRKVSQIDETTLSTVLQGTVTFEDQDGFKVIKDVYINDQEWNWTINQYEGDAIALHDAGFKYSGSLQIGNGVQNTYNAVKGFRLTINAERVSYIENPAMNRLGGTDNGLLVTGYLETNTTSASSRFVGGVTFTATTSNYDEWIEHFYSYANDGNLENYFNMTSSNFPLRKNESKTITVTQVNP